MEDMKINFWKNYIDKASIKSLPKELKCAICKLIMIEPYFLSCSHDLCVDCKDILYSKDKVVCNICDEEIENVMLNKKIIKNLKEIEISCLNSNECIWKGDITVFENHCKECEFLQKHQLILNGFLKSQVFSEGEIEYNFCKSRDKSFDCQQRNEISNEISKYQLKEFKLNKKLINFDVKPIPICMNNCSRFNLSCDNCVPSIKKDEIVQRIEEKNLNIESLIDKENKSLKKGKNQRNVEIMQIKEDIKNLKEIFKSEIDRKNIEISQNTEEIFKLKDIIKYLRNENDSKASQLINMKEDHVKMNDLINTLENNLLQSPSAGKIKLNNGSPVHSLLEFSDDLLISGGHKDINYWNPHDYNLIKFIKDAHISYISTLRKLNKNFFISGSDDCSIKIWNVDSRVMTRDFNEHSNTIWDILILSSKKIASASADKLIKIWDINCNDSLKTFREHSNHVRSLIAMKETEIVSCSFDKTIKFWDLKTENVEKTLQAHSGYIFSLIKINDSQFASGSIDIKIWDYPHGNCLSILRGHTSYIHTIILIDENELASGSCDFSVKIWNISNGEKITSLDYHKSTIWAISKINQTDLVSGSCDKDIIVWKNYKKIK